MAASLPEFWQLLLDSQLVSAEQGQQLIASFSQVKGTAHQGHARTLAEWLISRGVVTRYQAMVLMAGRSGPFFYGDYKLYDRLESGALAGMFRAVHVPTQHPVVLQFLTGPATQDPQQWAALAPQLKQHSSIQHPHLQRCFEAVDLTSYRFLVVEDLRGQSLDQLLLGGQRLTPAEACRCVRCAALGLMPLHQRGLIHGDIRPARLWLEQGGNVKLLREPVSGFAPVFLSRPDVSGLLTLRADYLAPEFLQEGKQPDALTDIYALGCTLYELLAGQPPFPAAELRAKMHLHATQPIQSLEAAGVPQALTQVVTYLMAKNPAVRYQHLNQVIAQISPFVDASRLNVASPKPPATQAAYERALQPRRAPADATPPGPAGLPGARPAAAAAPAPGTASGQGTPAATAAAGSVLQGRQRHKPNQQRLLFQVGIGVGAVLLLLIVLLLLNSGSEQQPVKPGGSAGPRGETPVGSPPAESSRPAKSPPAAETSSRSVQEGPFEIVADDGKQPWQSPTAGQAVSLRYLPTGGQVFLIARPAALLASPEGPRVVQALGPAFAGAQAAWEAAAGVPLSQIEQLIVSFQDRGDPLPRTTLVVRPKTPVTKESLLPKLGAAGAGASAGSGSAEVFAGNNGWFYFLPAEEQGGVLVIGRAEEIKEVSDAQGAPPVLPAALEKLLRASDDQRHVTVLLAPNELAANFCRDGRPWSFCDPRRVREPVDWFLSDAQAAVFSVHVTQVTYVELTFVRRRGTGPVEAIQDRLRQMPERVERYVANLNPAPYWRVVALRFPQMVRYLCAQTRVGAEGDLTVVNAALPPAAAHNLIFATEMALTSPALSAAPVPVPPAGP
ncbi:MAG: serine/threonine protein kinase [Candidatus Anammoximicrobium sp.]|nr:serine/threonine protein kinase [Candidatus Anammoximicrobium sp.]